MRRNTKTIFDSVFQQLLLVYDTGEAASITYLLMEKLLGVGRTDIMVDREIEYGTTNEQKMKAALQRLENGEPIQYVLGETLFYGRPFSVDRRVLIPRQETEELIHWIISSGLSGKRILDIGTGSGCIAISLALELKDCLVTGWDVSPAAIEVALRNASQLKAQITFQEVDVRLEIPEWKFDLIVSNPPYVLESERDTMHHNVLKHEPALALFVEDDDPLFFYRRIVSVSKDLLTAGGWLYFEINAAFGHLVAELMEAHGFDQVVVRKDLNGKDRMVRGRIR